MTQAVRDHGALRQLPEVQLAASNALLFGACGLAGHLDLGTPAGTGVAVLFLVGVGVRLPRHHAVFTGLCTWGYVTGFVEHDAGLLTFGPGDLERLLLLVTIGLVVGRSISRAASPRPSALGGPASDDGAWGHQRSSNRAENTRRAS